MAIVDALAAGSMAVVHFADSLVKQIDEDRKTSSIGSDDDELLTVCEESAFINWHYEHGKCDASASYQTANQQPPLAKLAIDVMRPASGSRCSG